MKTLSLLLVLLFSFSAFAISNAKVEDLLRQRGLTVEELGEQGMEVFMGENTGHLPFNKVRIIITENEAILRSEIDSVDLSGSTLGSVKSVRYNGRYLLKSDIKAAVSKR